MKFYLGTHETSWLGRTAIPLFVSRRRLALRTKLPRALGTWGCDSGGFTELSIYGKWSISPMGYVNEIQRYVNEIGNLEWAAPMDWMCEPVVLAKTGKTVKQHQELTIENFRQLRSLGPHLPFVPVLQGWTSCDYLHHVEMYSAVGIDLTRYKRVGIGTVCRRQDTAEAEQIISQLAQMGIPLHGFGFKIKGLLRTADQLVGADSMSWSRQARFDQAMPGCTHKTCANCFLYAARWRAGVLRSIACSLAKPRQLLMQLKESA